MICEFFVLNFGIIAKFLQTFNSECMNVKMLEYVHHDWLDVNRKLVTSGIGGIVNNVGCTADTNDLPAEILFVVVTIMCSRVRTTPPKFVGQLSAPNAMTFSSILQTRPVSRSSFVIVSEVSFGMNLMASLKVRTPSVSSKPRTSTGSIFSAFRFDVSVINVTNLSFARDSVTIRLISGEMTYEKNFSHKLPATK